MIAGFYSLALEIYPFNRKPYHAASNFNTDFYEISPNGYGWVYVSDKFQFIGNIFVFRFLKLSPNFLIIKIDFNNLFFLSGKTGAFCLPILQITWETLKDFQVT